uniref:Mitochondrial resolvase Ydc2 catalytic domain-containing protein n=1 Tax=viral metagenome TaxID=1070528 RepID=A0A6C0EU41_9ZZZZ
MDSSTKVPESGSATLPHFVVVPLHPLKVLSIDVGIKNLAFCLLEKSEDNILNDFRIVKWDTINLSQDMNYNCCEISKNVVCNKPAKFIKGTQCFCLKHAKKQPFKIPTAELKPTFINKQKIQTLHTLAVKYDIKIPDQTPSTGFGKCANKPIKRTDLIALINDHINKTCFNPIIKTNASTIDLITIGRNIKIKLDEILSEDMSSLTHVIIENQISPIANRMKTIQGMIAQYFIMRNNDIRIEFVSSVNKLKDAMVDEVAGTGGVVAGVVASEITDAKKKYKDRKLLGIQRCLHLVNNNDNYKEWCSFFTTHAKKDDLADALLQGIWFVNKNKN